MDEVLELSKTLFEIYKKNLDFLKENFEDVYEKVEKLSKQINNQEYQCKYSLEYRDGYFDILNTKTNSWYYGCNSYYDSDMRAYNSNFSKDGSLDLLRKGIDGTSLVIHDDMKNIMPIISHINENVDLKNIEFDKIYKFIFIGTGLGIHIHTINKKLQPFTTLIIEPELEVFRLSLFITDYSELQKGNSKLFLSIQDDKQTRISVLDGFYNYHNYMNYNIKHHLLIENDKYLYDEIVSYFSTNSVLAFPYTHTIRNLFITKTFAKDGYKFLNFDTMLEKKVLLDKHILLIAAGPSLDNYTAWIKENQDKFIVICVDVIVKKLEKANIIPDIVVSIDPSHLCAEFLDTHDKDFLNNSAIILLSQQHDDVLDVIKKDNTYISQSIPLFRNIGYLGSASNVGTVSYMFAVHLGAKNIYTIGTDAAFNQKTGNRYAEDSSYKQSETLEDLNEEKNLISSYDIIEVKGNLRDKVKTNRSLLAFKDSFESVTFSLKKYYEYDVYNLSDGVLIDGFSPLTHKELIKQTKNLSKQSDNILDTLSSVSTVFDKEAFDFNTDLKKIINIINKIKKHRKLKLKNRQEFLENKLEIMVWILEQSKNFKISVFGNIFLLYTEFVDIYINFYLNIKNQDLFDEAHLIKLNEIWSDGVLNVLNDFKKIASDNGC